ncbi:MAG: DNA translocase FtsK, partial [Alphaproteobacteria bacterium MarineAlpha2_Bin1]
MTNTNRDISFLPKGATSFFKKRTVEVLAIILLILSLFLLISLVSFSKNDPSLNNLTDSKVSNWFGLPGAIIADISIQIFGFSIYLLIPILMSWSWRLISHKGVKKFWLKICTLILTLGVFSFNHELLLNFYNKFSLTELSGLVGSLIYKYSIGLISTNINIFYLISSLFFILGCVSFIYTLSLGIEEWKKIGQFFKLLLKKIFYTILWFSRTGEKLAFKPSPKKGSTEISDNTKLKTYRFKFVSKIFSAKFFKKLFFNQSAKFKHKIEPTLSNEIRKTNSISANQESNIEKKGRISKNNQKIIKGKREGIEAQAKLGLDKNIIELPPLHLLSINTNKKRTVSEEALEQNARMLESVLSDFGISGEIIKVRPGPVVTLYELEPARGIKASRVISLADDIARSMSAISARVAVIPGQNVIGIELPNSNRETVYLRELLSSKDSENSGGKLTLALGKDIGGEPIFADLTRMPHLLVAGT